MEVGSLEALARDRSISSCVRFLDLRNSMRFSRGAEATEGSWRKVTAELTRSSRGAMSAVDGALRLPHEMTALC